MNEAVRAISFGLLVGTAVVNLITGENDPLTVVIHNSQHVLYVKCGLGASSTDYTYRLTRNSTLEIERYVGSISAVASQDYTFVRVTELV